MSNMGYCRFQNTLGDLKDCLDNLNDDLSGSKEEAKARIKLVDTCQRIVNEADLALFILENDEAKLRG